MKLGLGLRTTAMAAAMAQQVYWLLAENGMPLVTEDGQPLLKETAQ